MAEHRIRLAGPWELLIDDEWQRMKLPGTVPGPEAVLRRSFNTPSNLGVDQQVCCEIPPEFGTIECVTLDDIPLKLSAERRVDLSAHLHGFHRLQISCHPMNGIVQPPTLVIM